MRPGRVTLLASLAVVAGAVAVFAARLVGTPDLPPASRDPLAGLRVQERIAQLLLREGGLSRQREPISVTEGDLNAFLSRHVGVRRAGFSAVAVGLEPGKLTVSGRTTLGRVLAEVAPAWVSAITPGPVGDLPVWLVAEGRVRIANGHGRFVVDAAAMGRQPVSIDFVRRLAPAELFVEWRAPRVIERVEVEADQLVVHTRPR